MAADRGMRSGGACVGPARTIRLDVRFEPVPVRISRRVRQVRWQFGLAGPGVPTRPYEPVLLPLEAGRITLITGPSGTGKSATLRELARQLGQRAVRVDEQAFDPRRAIVDQVAPEAPLGDALGLLAACGLGEPRLWLRPGRCLSEGEQFRAKLAKAAALAADRPGAVLLADEFCATLHRRLAVTIAFNLRKLVTQRGLCLVVATTHEDLAADLQPDQVLATAGPRAGLPAAAGRPDIQPISLLAELRIEEGCLRDYQVFGAMHYRQREGLGPVDKVFVLRERRHSPNQASGDLGRGGEALGIVVYGYPPLALRMRNEVTGGVYHRRGEALNRDFRILRRLVMHPDVRGCGLGHRLVARTLPQVGTKYVECLAAMGAVNPVFERAGMVRIGTAGLAERRAQLREALAALGVDPLQDDLARLVATREPVRRVVARTVHAWLRGTTGRPIERIRRMTPRQLAAAFMQLMGAEPVYYLWSSDPTEMERLRAAAERLA